MPFPAETLFAIANAAAASAWLLLILLPNWTGTRVAVRTGLLPIVLALGYSILIVVYIGEGQGGFESLPAVQELFGHPFLLLAGWVHYLAFDLFVGIWELADAQRRRIPHLLTIPSLVLTFMLGPAGLLLYLLTRIVASKWRGSPTHAEDLYRLTL